MSGTTHDAAATRAEVEKALSRYPSLADRILRGLLVALHGRGIDQITCVESDHLAFFSADGWLQSVGPLLKAKEPALVLTPPETGSEPPTQIASRFAPARRARASAT